MLLSKEDADLFLDVAPAFVAALPPPPPRDDLSLDDICMLARDNSNTELRFEIRELLATFTKQRANHDLTFDDHKQAADALEDILYLFEELIDDSIIRNGTPQLVGQFRKLEFLRQYLVSCNPHARPNGLFQVPNEVRRWILYFEPGKTRTEAAQYRRIARLAKDFNSTMGKIFQSRVVGVELRPTQVFQEDRNAACISSESDERDLTEYAKLSSAIKGMVKVILDVSKACQACHSSYIHLSGFYETTKEVQIETIMTVCEPGRSEIWHPVHWVGSSVQANKFYPPQSSTTTICGRLRQIRKIKKKLCIKVCPDGSWEEVGTGHRMKAHIKPPEMILQDLLTSRQSQRDHRLVAPPLTKRDRLDLGIRIARSLLCLIGSPLLQCQWKSENIMVSHDEDYQTKAYIQNDPLTKTVTPESRKHIVVELGALLWELFFAEKVNILDEDEEIDDEDEISSLSLYNALNREESAYRDRCVEVECLDIIANCLDAYDKMDDLDDKELRIDIYDKIVKPLKEYIQSYNTKPIRGVTSPSLNRFLKPLHRSSLPLFTANESLTSQLASMFTATLSVQETSLQDSNPKIIGNRLKPAFLASNTNTVDSSTWLERFRLANDRLIPIDESAQRDSVRVAILDTGCDLEDKFFCGPGIGYVDDIPNHWLDCVDETPRPIDEAPDKHGTALTALLLRLIPRATIYVVRVARDSEGLLAGEEIVAKAITEVVKKWNIDIISMSFGFGDEITSIKTAIAIAENEKNSKILFFAAANNDGLNEPEMFPAFFEPVISVRGTRHDGVFKPQYNPNTWNHKTGIQYGTLAQDVQCGWVDDRLTKSGCSVATPIMAAIAATIILFVGRNFPQDHRYQNLVRTRRGILRVFWAMAGGERLSKNIERLYVAPWQLFEAKRDPVHIIGGALTTLP